LLRSAKFANVPNVQPVLNEANAELAIVANVGDEQNVPITVVITVSHIVAAEPSLPMENS
jgi:hypothetical protein